MEGTAAYVILSNRERACRLSLSGGLFPSGPELPAWLAKDSR